MNLAPTTLEQLLTPEQLAWVLNKSSRSVERISGGKKRKPQISVTKVGGENRYTPAAVLEYIIANTVRADYGGVRCQVSGDDEFWQKVQRLIETVIAARLERKEAA